MDSVDLEFDELNDDDLLQRIENAAVIKEMELSPGWKLIDEVCKRTASHALVNLKNTNPTDASAISQHQQIAKLYGDVLGSLIDSFKQEAALAFPVVKGRGLIDKIKAGVQAFMEVK